MSEEFYLRQLYPLQDKVLALIQSLDTPFYLTGGTALARLHLHHRYSDDLDLFVNRDAGFRKYADAIIATLKENFTNIELGLVDTDFVRMFLESEGVILKVELINDVGYRTGGFEVTEWFDRIDNWMNILSNKICAISRDHPKDMVDILFLANRYPFDWITIIEDAFKKDHWVNEIEVAKAISSFNCERVTGLKWMIPYSVDEISQACQVIAKDILHGRNNTLAPN